MREAAIVSVARAPAGKACHAAFDNAVRADAAGLSGIG